MKLIFIDLSPTAAKQIKSLEMRCQILLFLIPILSRLVIPQLDKQMCKEKFIELVNFSQKWNIKFRDAFLINLKINRCVCIRGSGDK